MSGFPQISCNILIYDKFYLSLTGLAVLFE